MADPYWGLEKLTKAQQKKLLRTLLTHPIYGSVVVKELFPTTSGAGAFDSGYADALVNSWAEEKPVELPDKPPTMFSALMPRTLLPGTVPSELPGKLNAALTTVARAQSREPGLAMYAEDARPIDALLKDLFRKSDIEGAFDSWNKSIQAVNLASQAGEGFGRARAEADTSVSRMVDESMLSGAGAGMGEGTALTPRPAREPRTPLFSGQELGAISAEIAALNDQADLLEDEPDSQDRNDKLARIQTRLRDLYGIQMKLWEAREAEKIRTAKDTERESLLAWEREKESAVAGRHAAGLQQSTAQFSERMAFEREQERANLIKYQEDLNNQLRELTMQAAQLNLPEGFQFEGPYGPVTPPTTQVTLPTQATNVQAALAAAGALG